MFSSDWDIPLTCLAWHRSAGAGAHQSTSAHRLLSGEPRSPGRSSHLLISVVSCGGRWRELAGLTWPHRQTWPGPVLLWRPVWPGPGRPALPPPPSPLLQSSGPGVPSQQGGDEGGLLTGLQVHQTGSWDNSVNIFPGWFILVDLGHCTLPGPRTSYAGS